MAPCCQPPLTSSSSSPPPHTLTDPSQPTSCPPSSCRPASVLQPSSSHPAPSSSTHLTSANTKAEDPSIIYGGLTPAEIERCIIEATVKDGMNSTCCQNLVPKGVVLHGSKDSLINILSPVSISPSISALPSPRLESPCSPPLDSSSTGLTPITTACCVKHQGMFKNHRPCSSPFTDDLDDSDLMQGIQITCISDNETKQVERPSASTAGASERLPTWNVCQSNSASQDASNGVVQLSSNAATSTMATSATTTSTPVSGTTTGSNCGQTLSCTPTASPVTTILSSPSPMVTQEASITQSAYDVVCNTTIGCCTPRSEPISSPPSLLQAKDQCHSQGQGPPLQGQDSAMSPLICNKAPAISYNNNYYINTTSSCVSVSPRSVSVMSSCSPAMDDIKASPSSRSPSFSSSPTSSSASFSLPATSTTSTTTTTKTAAIISTAAITTTSRIATHDKSPHDSSFSSQRTATSSPTTTSLPLSPESMMVDDDYHTYPGTDRSRVRCHWTGCLAELDTLTDLLNHLSFHHVSPMQNNSGVPLLCQWDSCWTQHNGINHLLWHLRNHHINPAFPATSLPATPMFQSSPYIEMDMHEYSTTSSSSSFAFSNVAIAAAAAAATTTAGISAADHHHNPSMWGVPSPEAMQYIIKQEPHQMTPSQELHLQQQQQQQQLHPCLWRGCKLSFPQFESLTAHLSEEHIGMGKSEYICEWANCDRQGRGFGQRQKAMRHIQTHTGDKPFQCEVCQKRFSEANIMAQHMRTHTGEKPFKCTEPGCGRQFSISGALTIHRRVHTGEKPFKCKFEGCDKWFAESSNLTKHLRVHTGERPFQCPYVGCDKRFSRPDQVTRHKKTHLSEQERMAVFKR